MALHLVAAERLAGAQGRLDVHPGRRTRLSAGERLGHDVEGEPSVRGLDDREADAVDRDRVADLGRRRRLDDEPALANDAVPTSRTSPVNIAQRYWPPHDAVRGRSRLAVSLSLTAPSC